MPNRPVKPGTLVISLDFELMWGLFDKVTTDSYGENLSGVHQVVPKILELFRNYEVHATWATVGMLMAENLSDLQNFLPGVKPDYAQVKLSAYQQLPKLNESTSHLYFAPKLVRQIVETPGQELASHTFCHYYCREAKNNRTAFPADCQAHQKISQKYCAPAKSLVFPRNQVTTETLEMAKTAGFKTYRGNEDSFLYRHGTESRLPIRLMRLLDHYCNLTGHHTHQVDDQASLINIPASRFFRPHTKGMSLLEPLRLRRIKRAMTHAAKNGEVFHLWWHPHNFGINQEINLANLKTILKHYQYLNSTYNLQSKSMSEFIPANEPLVSGTGAN